MLSSTKSISRGLLSSRLSNLTSINDNYYTVGNRYYSNATKETEKTEKNVVVEKTAQTGKSSSGTTTATTATTASPTSNLGPKVNNIKPATTATNISTPPPPPPKSTTLNNQNNNTNNNNNNNNESLFSKFSIRKYVIALGLGFTFGILSYQYLMDEDYLFSSKVDNISKDSITEFNNKFLKASTLTTPSINDNTTKPSFSTSSPSTPTITPAAPLPSSIPPPAASPVEPKHPHPKGDVIENISNLVIDIENKLIDKITHHHHHDQTSPVETTPVVQETKKVEDQPQQEKEKEETKTLIDTKLLEQVFEHAKLEKEEKETKDKQQKVLEDLIDSNVIPVKEGEHAKHPSSGVESSTILTTSGDSEVETTTFKSSPDESIDTTTIFDELDKIVEKFEERIEGDRSMEPLEIIVNNDQDSGETNVTVTSTENTGNDESSLVSSTQSQKSTEELLQIIEQQYINQIKQLIAENIKLKEEIETNKKNEVSVMEQFEQTTKENYDKKYEQDIVLVIKESMEKIKSLEDKFKSTLDENYTLLNESVEKQRENLTNIFQSQKNKIEMAENEKQLIATLTATLIDLKRVTKERAAFTPLTHQFKLLEELSKNDAFLSTVVKSFPKNVPSQGVASIKMIREQFQSMASELRKESLLPDDESWLGKTLSSIASKLILPEKGMVEGDDIDSTLSRAEEFLRQNNLTNALKEVDTIYKRNPKMKPLMVEWIMVAQDRLMVENMVQILESKLTITLNEIELSKLKK